MNDLTKILLTAFGGLSVVILGQLIGKFVIEPIHDLKRILGEIRYSLVFHAQAISTPVGDTDKENEAAVVLRKLSCDLLSKVDSIPCYDFWSSKFPSFLPLRNMAMDAASNLMGLSNSVHKQDRDKNYLIVAKIQRCLNITPLE